jgi:hypothetical protein
MIKFTEPLDFFFKRFSLTHVGARHTRRQMASADGPLNVQNFLPQGGVAYANIGYLQKS